MHITVWRDAVDFCFLYRLGYPLWEAQSQGLAEVDFRTRWEPAALGRTDVLVAQRMLMGPALQAWIDAARTLPDDTLRVLEYDDDLLSLRPDQVAASGLTPSHYRELVALTEQALGLADLVTVTGAYLGGRLARHTDAAVAVLPNTIQSLLLQHPAPVRSGGEPLRVGWAGTTSHVVDWQACRRGIREGLRASRAELVVGGLDVRELAGYPATYRPGVSELGDYYAMISDFHVMLAPLVDDEFNRSKSPLKALEAAALGIPVIASDVEPYRGYVIPGETGFLCRTAADWKRAITTLASDEELRRTMALRAREVAASYVTQSFAPLWVETYAGALATKRARLAVAG